MRLNPQSPTISATEERIIRDKIAELKAKLPPREPESREPLHAQVVRTYLDGASHSRSVDLNNEWAKTGHGIREAIRQGGEVVVRPMYPGEQAQEHKYYPGRERLRVLEEFVAQIASVDPMAYPWEATAIPTLVLRARGLVETKP